MVFARPDHYLQDIRAILFNPSTRKESKEPKSGPSIPLPAATKEPEETDDVPSVPLPGRRKKRSMSISSLVRQPKASSETVMIGRKKPGQKKAYAPRGSTLSINEPTGKEDEVLKSSTPHLTLSKDCSIQRPGPNSKIGFAELNVQVVCHSMEVLSRVI